MERFEFPVPPSVELMNDIRPADWLQEIASPGGGGEGVLVGEIVPTGFESYARIFHPAYRSDGRETPVRWSEIADERGRIVHPEMQFEHLVGTANLQGREWDGRAPFVGCLPEGICAILGELLWGFTETPGRCWFCVWGGYGIFGGGNSLSWTRGEGGWLVELRRRRALRRSTAIGEVLDAIPKVDIQPMGPERIPLRSYFLLHGPVEAASGFRFGAWYQSPNLWWPDDRTWCVATEIDGSSTYVGGSRACVERLLEDDRLEALPSRTDRRFDLGSDRLNPTPPDMPPMSWDTD